MKKVDIGLVGLAVMGENLVMNMESKGFTVAVYNRTVARVKDFVEGRAQGKNIIGTYSLKELGPPIVHNHPLVWDSAVHALPLTLAHRDVRPQGWQDVHLAGGGEHLIEQLRNQPGIGVKARVVRRYQQDLSQAAAQGRQGVLQCQPDVLPA